MVAVSEGSEFNVDRKVLINFGIQFILKFVMIKMT